MARLVTLIFVPLLTACASLPAEDGVAGFGAATGRVAGSLEASFEAMREIEQDTVLDVEISNFLQGRGFDLSPELTAQLSPEQTSLRLSAMRALGDYGDALASAADPATVRRLQAASMRLTESVGGYAGLAGPQASPLVGPVSRLAGRTMGYVLGAAYAREIRKVIEATHEPIEALAAAIKEDQEVLALALEGLARDFEGTRADMLVVLRRSGTGGAATPFLHQAYSDAAADVAAISAQRQALVRMPELLDRMVAAHAALRDADENTARALVSAFVASADDLAAIISATN